MIALPEGYQAHAFITACERMVGVRMFRGTIEMGNLPIDTTDKEQALRQLKDWLSAFGLNTHLCDKPKCDKGCGNNRDAHDQLRDLVTSVLDEVDTLKVLRTEGPGTVGWLGSTSDRRLGSIYCAA